MSLIISPPPTDSSQRQFGTITRVQSISGNTGNAAAASFTLTFGASLTVGNLLVITAHFGASTAIARCADGGGNLAFLSPGYNTGTTQYAALGFMIVQTAGTTITINLPASATFIGAGVGVEYSGVKLRVDTNPINASSASASNATSTIVTTGSNDLLVAALGKRGTYAAEQTAWLTSPTNSFSSVLQTSSFVNSANTDATIAFLERIVSSPGSYSTAGTQANTGWANTIGAFVSD